MFPYFCSEPGKVYLPKIYETFLWLVYKGGKEELGQKADFAEFTRKMRRVHLSEGYKKRENEEVVYLRRAKREKTPDELRVTVQYMPVVASESKSTQT